MKKKTPQQYDAMVQKASPHSPVLKNCLFAFLSGGAICTLGQAFSDLYAGLGAEKSIASALASVSLIFLAGLLTGIGWFDVLAKFAGAGTLVPITGFANAVCSIAIESRSEGYVTGVCADMFKIAGPVIVFGTSLSVIYGVIYYFCI